MIGDLLSSFVKRRMHLPTSSQATGLDQIAEYLFPLLCCRPVAALTLAGVIVGVALFLIGEIARCPGCWTSFACVAIHTEFLSRLLQVMQNDFRQAVEPHGNDHGPGSNRSVANWGASGFVETFGCG